jgi:hypothetical protein
MNYSHITLEAGMVMKKASPVMISFFGRVPGRASKHSRTRVNDGGSYKTSFMDGGSGLQGFPEDVNI